jgi:translation elongation factor P/translation initiation factor 5A
MSVSGSTAQVMDSRTYEIYDINIPPELIANAAPGKEAEILESMGKRMMERIR